MAESCSLFAHCKNSKGEVVESRLFKDLLHYTSNNRALAKEYYGVGIDPEFLEMVQDRAKFDENGEITFQSLRKLAKLDVKKDMLIKTLNEDIKSGIYDYDEAMVKLQSFNRNSQFNEEFMATIVSTKDGKYKLSVVERTAKNESELNKEISNRSLQDRIKYYLNKAGVGIEFIENDERVNGRYSTKNAKKTANGLYQLIQIAKGENITGALAEEAGHFAIGALGKSPLVERLLKLLTPEEVQKQILGNEYGTKQLGESAAREIAGTLVGRALEGNIDKRAPWGSLISRIVNMAKRIAYTIKGDNISRAILEAEEYADRIAKGFMSPNFSGSVEEALKTKETLYSAHTSFNVQVFKDIINRLKLQASEMEAISESLFKKFNDIAGKIEAGRDLTAPTTFSDAAALEGIADAVVQMLDLMVAEIPDTLEALDFEDSGDFISKMPENAKALRFVRTYVKNSLFIVDLIKSQADMLRGDKSNIILRDKLGNPVSYDLAEIADKLNNLIRGSHGVMFELQAKERAFFLKFLENVNYGRNYIARAARVIFKWTGGKILKHVNAENIPLSNILTYLESDISVFERFLSSMSNNSDVIGQLIDRAVKLANKIADDKANKAQDRLRLLQTRLEEIGLKNTDIFIERSERHGTITGNIISPVCWGDYENDWLEFKNECIKEFNATYPNLEGRSDFEKALLWDDFFKPQARVWHKGDESHPPHSSWDSEQHRYVPHFSMYENTQYNRDIAPYKERVAWLKEYMDLKNSIDEALPTGSIPLHRLPQFKGTFSNKIRNRRLLENRGKATIHTVMTEIRDIFCEDSEDTEYGSEQTYNTIEEDMFRNQLAFEREKVNRVPLYGINKLKDPSELSTDLFYSTFAYAGMAYSYEAMSKVVDTLEVGKEVLNERRVAGINKESERNEDKSRAYNRYIKYLEKQVYGIGTKKIKIGNRLVLNKLLGFLTRFASKYFLGGNVAGGMVNTGTGFIEVFKEANAGEFFDLNDWRKAHGLYFGSFVQNWWGYGKEFKEDKISLMMRHFNMLNENRTKQRGWHTRDSRILNMFCESLYLPYKSGDHYMSSIAYLALAHKTKLYDVDGNKISLFNAYKIYDIGDEIDERGNVVSSYDYKKKGQRKRTLKLSGRFFKNKEDINKYNTIQSIISQIDKALTSTSLLGAVLNLTQEEQDYIDSKGYNLANMKDTKAMLESDAEKLTWNVANESEFMDKAREINIRMHGIYNNQDKVAFQQNLFGNMLLAMRGYALGMIERRFGANKHSTVLQQDVEGSAITLAKVFAYAFTDRMGFKLTLRALLLPVGKRTKQAMLGAGFSANQYYNMRRFRGDALFILALMLLKGLTAKGGDDDDDDENTIRIGGDDTEGGEVDTTTGLVYYFASRLLREQEAFTTIRGLSEEVPTVTNLTPVGVSALYDASDLAWKFAGSLVTDDSNSSFYYQSDKSGVHEKGDAKWEEKFWKRFPYLRSTYVLNNPYEAAESYAFGRKVRK